MEAEYCNYVTPSVTEVRDILNAPPYSLNVSSAAFTITDASVASQILEVKRPVMAIMEWVANPSSTKHVVLIVGSDVSGQNVIIMDPGKAQYIQLSSDELRTEWEGWRWIQTITMNANAPADVFLRYSEDYSPYKYYASGNIEAGPNFKLWHSQDLPGDTELWVPANKKITFKKGFSVAAGRKFRAY